MNNQELKLAPCPFCGGKAEPDALMIGEAGKDNATPHGHFIECQTCLALSGSHDIPEAAAEAWNQRTQRSPSSGSPTEGRGPDPKSSPQGVQGGRECWVLEVRGELKAPEGLKWKSRAEAEAYMADVYDPGSTANPRPVHMVEAPVSPSLEAPKAEKVDIRAIIREVLIVERSYPEGLAVAITEEIMARVDAALAPAPAAQGSPSDRIVRTIPGAGPGERDAILSIPAAPVDAMAQLRALMEGLQIENQDLLLTKPTEIFRGVGEAIAMASGETAAARNAGNKMVERIFAESIREVEGALVWSREKPKVDGWYWYASGGHTVGIEWVLVSASGRASWINMMTDESEPIPDGLEWAGPIPEPSSGSPERAEGPQ